MQAQSFNLYSNFFLFFAVLIIYGSFTNAQITIPSKFDGFWYNKEGSIEANSIYIEAFFDPVCPDSRDAWPPLKEAINHYSGSQISLVVHTFPLPYHDNAYLCSRALHIVDQLNISATYKLLEAFFQQQDNFSGKATSNSSRVHVRDQIAKFTIDIVGSSYASAIKLGFLDYKTDQATRFAFKYGCLKGVYGTPFFFVNGFPLPDAGSPIDFNGWKRIIDPLINEQHHIHGSLRLFL